MKGNDRARADGLTDFQSDKSLPSLAPARLGPSELSRYEGDFNKVFSDDAIRNVALSGPYGAGKSSVMQSWCKAHPEHKALYVSLAHFDNGMTEQDPEGVLDGSRRRELEWRLINQLVHKADLRKAPKSRFRHTRTTSRPLLALALIVVAAVCLFSMVLTNWKALGLEDDFMPWVTWAKIIACALAVTVAFAVVAWKDLAGRFVRKLKFMDVEAELQDGNDDTLFDVYLDDILYLLTSLEEDVVVFEDIDRYDTLVPFEELREINDLVNHARSKKKSSTPLRFFYLIRDSVFRDPYERTKFFDFIIPVIPFVDPDNSQALLTEWFDAIELRPSDNLLFALSNYIDDPRILYDVVNEARHYASVVFDETQAGQEDVSTEDVDRLVALLAYKAFFPGDFELLQRGRGFVHAVMHQQRDRMLALRVEALEEEVARVEEERLSVELTIQEHKDEVALMFLWLQGRGRPSIGNYGFSQELSREQTPRGFLHKVNSNKDASRQWREYVSSNLESNQDYQDQAEMVGAAGRARLAKLEGERDRLTREIQECRNKRLSGLIAGDHDEAEFSWDAVAKWDYGVACSNSEVAAVHGSGHFPLLALLLSRGWIDESYPRYISSFREGDLSFGDRELLKDIRSGRRIDPKAHVDDPEALLRHMSTGEAGSVNAWNHALSKALFQSGGTKLDAFARTLSGGDARGYVLGYVLSDQFVTEALTVLSGLSSDPIRAILAHGRDEGVPRNFLHTLLSHNDKLQTSLAEGPYAEELRALAEADKEFLCVHEDEFSPQAIAGGLLAIGYRAKDIDVRESNRDLLLAVCDDGMLVPDASLVDSLLAEVYGIKGSLESGCLVDGVLKSGAPGIVKAIEDDPDAFLSSLFAAGCETVHDESASLVWVANCYEDHDQLDCLNEYLGCVIGSSVEDIGEVRDPQCVEMVMGNLCMGNTGSNIARCLLLDGLTVSEDLASHISYNDVPADLNAECLARLDITVADATAAFALCGKIEGEKLSDIVRGIRPRLDAVDKRIATGVSSGRMGILCEAGLLACNEDNLTFLIGKFPDAVSGLAESDPDGFYRVLETNSPLRGRECVVAQFANRDVELPVRVRMLKLYDKVPLHPEYEDELIVELIERNHLREEDLPELPAVYARAEESAKHVRDVIEKRLASCSYAEFRSFGSGLTTGLSVAVIQRKDHESAKAFVASQLSFVEDGEAFELRREEFASLLRSGGLEDWARFVTKQKPKKNTMTITNPSSEDDLLCNGLVRLQAYELVERRAGKTKLVRARR